MRFTLSAYQKVDWRHAPTLPPRVLMSRTILTVSNVPAGVVTFSRPTTLPSILHRLPGTKQKPQLLGGCSARHHSPSLGVPKLNRNGANSKKVPGVKTTCDALECARSSGLSSTKPPDSRMPSVDTPLTSKRTARRCWLVWSTYV